MAWSVVQAKSATSASSHSLAPVFTSTPVTGNKVIAIGGLQTGGPGTWSAHDGNSVVLSLLYNDTLTGSLTDQELGVLVYDVPASPNKTITVANTGSVGGYSVVILEVSGLTTGTTAAAILDGSPSYVTIDNAAPGSSSTTGYASTAVSEFLLTIYTDAGSPNTVTQPTGFTLNASSVNGSSSADLCVAYKNSTGGTESDSWSGITTAAEAVIGTVAFKVPGAGPAFTPPPPKVVDQAVRRAIFY